MQDLGIYVRVILKWTSNKYDVILYNKFKWLESDPMSSPLEHSNKF